MPQCPQMQTLFLGIARGFNYDIFAETVCYVTALPVVALLIL